MNQNTTIETIRMIANRLLNPDSNRIDVRSDLCDLANRLEAAQQPPVEQNEPAAEHPLHELPERIREIARLMREEQRDPYSELRNLDGWAVSLFALADLYAPTAVIEPEPELDEFEKLLMDEMPDDSGHSDYNKGARDAYMWCRMKYREIISRKGDK